MFNIIAALVISWMSGLTAYLKNVHEYNMSALKLDCRSKPQLNRHWNAALCWRQLLQLSQSRANLKCCWQHTMSAWQCSSFLTALRPCPAIRCGIQWVTAVTLTSGLYNGEEISTVKWFWVLLGASCTIWTGGADLCVSTGAFWLLSHAAQKQSRLHSSDGMTCKGESWRMYMGAGSPEIDRDAGKVARDSSGWGGSGLSISAQDRASQEINKYNLYARPFTSRIIISSSRELQNKAITAWPVQAEFDLKRER